MSSALFIIDVQNDFTEGGALAVEGGAALAKRVTEFLAQHPKRYDHVFASRDWHNAVGDNGGHFAGVDAPNFVTTWPPHCVADTEGAQYHPDLDTSAITIHVKKGQGVPAYSIFEGTTESGATVSTTLDELGVLDIDVVGIATDYCVRASALDALEQGRRVRILTDLIAGVSRESSEAALQELGHEGAQITESTSLE